MGKALRYHKAVAHEMYKKGGDIRIYHFRDETLEFQGFHAFQSHSTLQLLVFHLPVPGSKDQRHA